MARTKRQFGRRGPPVVTHRPEGLPEAKPTDPKRKRSLAISLISAGALAAAATHFLERGSAEECVPVAVPATGSTALPRISPTGAPTIVPPAPSVAASDGCPPGTVRSTTNSGSRRYTSSSWHWSSSRSSGSSFFGRSSSSSSASHASTSTTRRGGFGSIGSFHFSGGS